MESSSVPYKLGAKTGVRKKVEKKAKIVKCFFGNKTLNFLDHFVSQLLIELESSNQKNPHSQFIWGGDTFQSSIYHSFALNRVAKIKYAQ